MLADNVGMSASQKEEVTRTHMDTNTGTEKVQQNCNSNPILLSVRVLCRFLISIFKDGKGCDAIMLSTVPRSLISKSLIQKEVLF